MSQVETVGLGVKENLCCVYWCRCNGGDGKSQKGEEQKDLERGLAG